MFVQMKKCSKTSLKELQQLLTTNQYALLASVTDGFVIGMLCCGVDRNHQDYNINLQQVLNEGETLEPSVVKILTQISVDAFEHLNTGILQLKLAIEDDDESLTQRLKSIAEWSEGWLLGFGHGTDATKLSSDGVEVLGDIRNISQVEFDIDGSLSEEDTEEMERAYTDILGHLKVSVEMLFLEKKQALKQSMPAQKSDNIH